jgi:hypothetical protein
MMSGEYFLTKEQKEAKAQSDKKDRQLTKKQERIEAHAR